ncbi:DNA-dependent protein kinase catalytic subunit-like [Copidosoma floridanum]|uniref:DNA-dependent protein kinase catalytic subunit-like n=1 Tax=Copidosoma floridanum TaxID=29053 RepID=UPI000C6F4E62|nr:DNA-dependent protein kinase catalytic subunit-like [Copidosoma floridanum]
MRQDERMQQLFESINQSLSNDSRCIERHLFAFTYNIIPINTYLGLVQWVKEAKSLRDFVEFTMTDKTILNEISIKYQEWIMQANDENSNVKSKCYKQALLKYSPDEVEAKIKELTGLLDWDLLRKTFVKITSSIESFFKLRQNFILSYAVMCTVDWIAGIGDRRLDNILIEVSTGKCFGIDHKMVFGTGIDQPVPELVPFRLTSQIMGLLRPFTPKDLFGASMSHVLAALRNEKNLILIYLNMLLLEDLKWDHLVEERWLQDCNHYDGEWLPKFKLEIAQKKLNGEKPSLIMINELSSNHNNHENQYFSINKCILRGNEFKHDNIRAHIKDCNLTPEEQMLCLVDQATDVNILGRICVEWYPFV